ncbi:uncharacterized protein K02A2.6-like [Scylla paramamosain]|uniref:uncharacterized protein K02A2.6-like n=1 Tax=Scylla paramamosain TaxID=85552 RepID=UPI003082B740
MGRRWGDSIRERLGVSRGLVTYTFHSNHPRLVIPDLLRKQVAAHLHAGHQGIDSMLRKARQAVYWPGIEGDLRHHRNCCDTCNIQPPEPLLFTPPPDYPFQQTVVDLFQLEGHDYIVYADRLTGWLEVSQLPDGTESGRIKDVVRHHFSRWGAPEQLSMDGEVGVGVRVSSAHFPQSNGRAEVAVKSAKRILPGNTGGDGSLDNDKISLALLQYLNTPLRDINRSPAQLATGRQLRDGLPSVKRKLEVDNFGRRTLRQRERQMADHHNRVVADRNVTRSRAPLAPGDRVLPGPPARQEMEQSRYRHRSKQGTTGSILSDSTVVAVSPSERGNSERLQ